MKPLEDRRKRFSRRKFLATVGLGSLGGIGYARLLEPGWLAVGQHGVRLSKRAGQPPLRLLHLSDFHASRVVSSRFIEKAVQLGLEQKPDLICLTGDFITCGYEDVHGYSGILSSLPKHAPTFACLGNHDGGLWSANRGGHRDTKLVRGLLDGAGVRLLHNSAETIRVGDRSLHLVGLGDSWAEEMNPETAFAGVPSESNSTLVLSHNPDTKEDLKVYQWDLLLCGHTHGGQLRLPFIGAPFAPVRDKNFVQGLHQWNNRWIHITRGIGNLYGLRVNCRPEVSLLTLL